MKFGPVPLDQAVGAIAAHSIRRPGGTIRKGTVLTEDHVAELRSGGVAKVTVARLAADDVHEDEAAERIARLVAGDNIRMEAPFTGRCNLFAEAGGLVLVNRGAVDDLNRLDPGLTLATLPEYAPVEAGRMVATVKIIPFAVPARAVERAEETVRAGVLSLAPWRPLRVGLAATVLPSLKPSTMDKTRRILDERLRPAGAKVIAEHRVGHDPGELANSLASLASSCDLVISFGASAVVDRSDVIPAAIEAAGGEITHFGMPVDPGNLLLLGRIGATPVLGAPGCARSPSENGFDWILNRLLAGLPVGPEDVTGMGVGGLLMEIVSRPQPRQAPERRTGSVAAIVLAAGQSRRMGGPNKLLARINGVPLVRLAVQAALDSKAAPVVVVTGHMADEIGAALAGLDVALAANPDFAEGLSTSLRAGIAALPGDAEGALVMLADMPGITAEVIDRLVDTFVEEDGPRIVLPTVSGKRGNPVLWSRHFFPDLARATGDSGGRHLLGLHPAAIRAVEVGPAVGQDIDTPDALAAAGGVLAR